MSFPVRLCRRALSIQHRHDRTPRADGRELRLGVMRIANVTCTSVSVTFVAELVARDLRYYLTAASTIKAFR